jgi:hypothetical protein
MVLDNLWQGQEFDSVERTARTDHADVHGVDELMV